MGVPEQQDGVGHRQLPTGHVGVSHAALGRPRVTGVRKESDETVYENVQLEGRGQRLGLPQPAPLTCPPHSLLLPWRGCDRARWGPIVTHRNLPCSLAPLQANRL